MDYYQQYKQLLEYFVAHLEWMQTKNVNGKGYTKYIKPLRDAGTFCSTGQGYNGGNIQNQISEWEDYENGIICINIQGQYGPYTSRRCYLNWEDTGINVIAQWNKESVNGLAIVEYNAPIWGDIIENQSLESLGLYDGKDETNEVLKEFFDTYNNLIVIYNQKQKSEKMKQQLEPYIKLLCNNKNMILTGAPGTGKTYLAKQIAEQMILDKPYTDDLSDEEREIFKTHFRFVQFHPSYDYTDFVEGLRPTKKGDFVGFERKDGIFKQFCSDPLQDQNMSFNEAYDSLVNDIQTKKITTVRLKSGKDSLQLVVTDHNTIKWVSNNETNSANCISKERLRNLYKVYNSIEKLNEMQNINNDIRNVINGCNTSNYWAVLNEMLKRIPQTKKYPYIFVIDEINRGEISKIFGELFFSIDPGYRGLKGRVQTQYQNLIEKSDIFEDGFYVPEDVYIIGTMNDIDRSVESMDFAMRRRFAWKEVKASDNTTMLDVLGELSEEVIKKMNGLNQAIEQIDGLNTAYHIGGAYFAKLVLYLNDLESKDDAYKNLWDNHLQGLLFEYLRGMPNVDEEMNKLKEAYDHQS